MDLPGYEDATPSENQQRSAKHIDNPRDEVNKYDYFYRNQAYIVRSPVNYEIQDVAYKKN